MAKELPERSYTTRQAGFMLGLSQAWIRACIREHKLRAYKPCGPNSNYRILESELERVQNKGQP